MANKLSTVFVTAIALIIALSGNESVFSLVIIAWSALASAFAPLLIVYVFGQYVRQSVAITMMIGGLAAMGVWRYLEFNAYVYEIAPGILAGLLIFSAATILKMNRQDAT